MCSLEDRRLSAVIEEMLAETPSLTKLQQVPKLLHKLVSSLDLVSKATLLQKVKRIAQPQEGGLHTQSLFILLLFVSNQSPYPLTTALNTCDLTYRIHVHQFGKNPPVLEIVMYICLLIPKIFIFICVFIY